MDSGGVRLRKRVGNRGTERETAWVYNEESVETKYSKNKIRQ